MGIEQHNEKALKSDYLRYKTEEMALVKSGQAKPYEKIVVSPTETHEFVVACGGILHKVTDKYSTKYTGRVERTTEDGKLESYYVKDFTIPHDSDSSSVYHGGVLDFNHKSAKVYFTTEKPDAIVDAIETTFETAVESNTQNLGVEGQTAEKIELPSQPEAEVQPSVVKPEVSTPTDFTE